MGLASRGGNLFAAVRIGEVIREKRFTTVVPDKETCASACALIWLAGAKRYAWNTARIGFHGAFDKNTLQLSGPGNAVVGAYLNKLGLSYEAMIYMTAASPTDMTWLHSADAKRLGIAADVLDDLNPDASISIIDQDDDAKLRSEAVTFVMNFFNQWNTLPAEKLMTVLATQYSGSVEYNGAQKTAGEILLEERGTLRRWPIRLYQLRSETMTTNCVARAVECLSTGVVDWTAKSPERSASVSGSSRFSLYLGKVSPERFVIMQQSIVVLDRRTDTK